VLESGVGKVGDVRRTFNLLRRRPREMIHLALIRRAAAMPKEQPLQALVPLQLVLEPEPVLLVREFQQIEQFGRGLHDGEGRGLGVIDDDGDAAVGVEAEEPFFLLLVGHDVDEGGGPFRAVDIRQFFEQDLHFLPVGRGHGDEVEALGRGERVRRALVIGWGRGCTFAFLTSSGVSSM
jgi:hypothetical protein